MKKKSCNLVGNNYPEIIDKKYLLSRIPIIHDITLDHSTITLSHDLRMNSYKISEIDGEKLYFPLVFSEMSDETDNEFNLSIVHCEYGIYYKITGKFSYSNIIKENNTVKYENGRFLVGFINNYMTMIYDLNEFNEFNFLEEHNDMIISRKRINNIVVIITYVF